jgi:hypothetical protein
VWPQAVPTFFRSEAHAAETLKALLERLEKVKE